MEKKFIVLHEGVEEIILNTANILKVKAVDSCTMITTNEPISFRTGGCNVNYLLVVESYEEVKKMIIG